MEVPVPKVLVFKRRKFGTMLSVLGLVIISGMWVACQKQASELPNLGTLPAFQLTNQDSQPVTLDQYKGKVWVANFIFTSCAGTCPMLTQRMRRVQDKILDLKQKGSVHPIEIVSFSVDPETDTPKRLKDYSKRHGANAAFWNFLTGPLDQVQEMVVKGFKISMGKVPVGEKTAKASAEEIFEVVHGEKFVLVDKNGNIRGYYDSQASGIQKLWADLQALLQEAS